MATKTIDNIIYPVQTKRGLKWAKKRPIELAPLNSLQDKVPAKIGKLLDGFLILYSCRVRLPHEAIKSKLSSQSIVDVIEEDLCYFQNLTTLDLSDNKVHVEQLRNLRYLCDLNLQFNQISFVPALNDNDFSALETLNLSYNKLHFESIRSLYVCKQLKTLDLAANSLEQLPDDMFRFNELEELNLSSNLLSSVSNM